MSYAKDRSNLASCCGAASDDSNAISSSVVWGRLALLMGVALVCAAVHAAVVEGRSPELRYRAYVVANATSDGCYGKVGLYVTLDSQAPHATKLGRVKQLARANRPQKIRLKLKGRVYRLAVDPRASGTAYRRVWWVLRRVPSTVPATTRWVGSTATIAYRNRGRHRVTRAVRVRNGHCE